MRITTRRLVGAAVLLGGFLLPGAAHAGEIVSFTDPTTGCRHTVWGPDIMVYGCPPLCPGIVIVGGFGETVSCP